MTAIRDREVGFHLLELSTEAVIQTAVLVL